MLQQAKLIKLATEQAEISPGYFCQYGAVRMERDGWNFFAFTRQEQDMSNTRLQYLRFTVVPTQRCSSTFDHISQLNDGFNGVLCSNCQLLLTGRRASH
jgi:hypothetical protein